MAQQSFGRRQSTLETDANRQASPGDAAASGGNRTAVKSVGILAAVGGLVAIVAIGGAVALNAATGAGTATPVQPGTVASKECRGQDGCANQYSVALRCGSSDEARSVSVVARDAEAAERKAERYNRDCRSRSVVLLTSFGKSPAFSSAREMRPEEPLRKVASNSSSRRTGFRLRRR